MRFVLVALLASVVLVPSAPSATRGDASVAALQVALARQHLYAGTVDGMVGPSTISAIETIQRRSGLVVDGRLGPKTLAALGPFATKKLGGRLMAPGAVGSDVAALQFLLAWHGFPSGAIDGVFKERVSAAVLAFQAWRALPVTGIAGPKTLAALRSEPPRSPLALSWPLRQAVADRFGPRHQRFHTGIDIPATTGTPVKAAAPGQVIAAGWAAGGWGYRVTIAHASGLGTISAHLSRVSARVGERVKVGQIVGLVGASGDARGPHLHFEARLRGAAVDPLPALAP